MEVIYPRDNRKDSEVAGVVGDGGVVENQEINQTFNDWLTQYFNEDNSKTIIETINNNAANMPDIGLNELLVAYMAKFEAELKRIKEAIQNMDLGAKLIENHTVIDLGAFNWNGNVENIYMLSGGVPSTITINQYINNICGVAIFGSEFQTLDAATGLINLSVYPVEYIQTLLDNNSVITIGADKYVPLTICDITINNNELGDQLPPVTETDDNTSQETFKFGALYNSYVLADNRKFTSSDDWKYMEVAERDGLIAYLGGLAVAGGKLKKVSDKHWNDPNTGATDEFGFGFIGGGKRSGVDGSFSVLKEFGGIRGKSSSVNFTLGFSASYNSAASGTGALGMKDGANVRFVKPAPGVADGETTVYVGNDGKQYTAVCINQVYWTPDVEETKFRTGEDIPNVTDDAAWAALAGSGMCLYNNAAVVETTNGGVTVVDGDNLSLIQIDPVTGLKVPVPVADVQRAILSSVLLRKI